MEYIVLTKKFLNTKNPNQEMLDLVKEMISECSKIYYETDEDSPLTDGEFDSVMAHYLKFKKYNVVTRENKMSKRLVEVSHSFPELVGTLDKTNFIYKKDKGNNLDTDSIEEWFIRKNIDPMLKLRVAISEKKDGNSVTLTYNKDGNIKNGLTRGKDGKGADVSNFFSDRKLNIFKNIQEDFGVKYEAMLDDENFSKVCELMGRTFANSRSLTSGLLSSLDGKKYSKYISLIPIRFQYLNKKISREKELDIIQKINNTSSIPFTFQIIEGNIKEILKGISLIYKTYIKEKRENLNHPIDGLVIEILNEDIRKKLGRQDDRNNFEFALKFPYLVKRSIVKDIEFYYGLSGRITPVVVFEPVEFNGAICTNVSIANYKRFKELELKIGDSIFVEYRNDVLAYITKDPKSNIDKKPIRFISKCPKCEEKLFINKTRTFVFCKNVECPGLILGKLTNWFEKLNIKGIKENTLQKIINAGMIKTIPDLYKLDKKSLMTINGFLDKSAINIITAINSRKEIYDWELLGSLSFKDVGRKTSKLFLKQMTLDEVLKNFNTKTGKIIDITLEEELIKIKGIERITARNIIKGIEDNYSIIKELIKILTIKSLKEELNMNSSKDSKKIVFTGFRDRVIQDILENKGHSVASNVSKNTDIVVAKDVGNLTTKLSKALELGIPIYSIDDFKNKILPSLIK